MLKRLFLTSVLPLSLVALLVSGAEARCRLISGVAFCSDFCVESCWSGLGNVDQKPVEVNVTVGVEKAAVLCQNGGNQSQTAQGNPFAVQITPINIGSAVVLSSDVSKNGKACLGGEGDQDFCIDGATIYNAIAGLIPEDACQNRNWSVVPDSAVITQGLVYYQAIYTDTGDLAASGCQECTRVTDASGCHYDCVALPDSKCAGLQ